ncbi:MAG: DNA-processing protein DprA [Tannerellaceae bacterium]|jgi:DNA processing protein|nr:DNA-processing protein DprA [Tannerellaceae bacterium]
MKEPSIYPIGLTMINGIGDVLGRQLLQTLGDAEAVFTEKTHVLEKIPGIGKTLAAEIKRPEVLQRAEKELAFIEKNKISCYFLPEADYPFRLRECPDAPLLIYFKGKTDLNARRIISVVGTRKTTDYGRGLTEKLIAGLAESIPELLIVSGLAYGIDIAAHRSALKHQLPTLGILAHGLDRIYPSAHRETAIEMLEHGGLLVDFPSGTNPDKPNFIRRNRIIAGLADATVVVESADRGGSLITAEIAFSYGRDVFAFPGRTSDVHSQGCNRIIRQNKAGLITCAADLILSLCWDVQAATDAPPTPPLPQQPPLLFTENDEESRQILTVLQEKKEMHINQLAAELNLPVYKLSGILFELEMNGQVKAIPGSTYKLK